MDTELEEPKTEQEEGAEPEEKTPLGMYAPFDVSDQKEWTKEALDAEEGGNLKLAEVIRAMVVAACQRESLGRRLEVERAWYLQLMDRGFHRLIPSKGGGWRIYGQADKTGLGIYGSLAEANLHDINIIGVHNDIIVNALKRDVPKTEFSPKTDEDEAVTAAAQANKLKLIICEDAEYRERQADVARLFCTDERVVLYMRPVADALQLGFEDDAEDVVPENETAIPAAGPSKRPRIQTCLKALGKLEHKCRIAGDNVESSPYQIMAWEEDTASERATFPWIAESIKGGSAGIAEIEMDRIARASIKLAIQGQTGQTLVNDTTRLHAWLTPKFYWDDSCTPEARKWLLKTYPKGFLAVYSGTELAFVRNEAWTEVLTIIHARSGKGQNRRSLTEAYAGPNMVLDNLFDLITKFFTSTVPRVFYDANAFNVAQLRQSGNTPGRKEPFDSDKLNPNVPGILQDPMPTHQPALPDFIHWLSGDLAQLLTGAQLTLQGAQNAEGDQGTLGEAQMDNDSAMTRLSEPWGAICCGFSNATLQAIQWNARVQPKGKVFDRITKDQGRIRIEMQNINADMLVVAENDVNIPESFTEREERIWALIQQMPANPYLMTVLSNPANARIIKDAARMGLVIPGATSWEKQEGEFTLLLEGQPQPNPKIAEMQAEIAKLQAEMQQAPQHAANLDPDQLAQTLEQGMQAIQQLEQQMQALPPLVSSVPIRPDNSEEHAYEAACCMQKMISPEGRRLANSVNELERLAFQNLHLHWFEHTQAAAEQAKANQQPVEPKASISLAVDKMPSAVQSEMLSKMGIAVPAQAFDEMGPHEVTHEVEGTNAEGAREKITTTLAGKSLN